MENSRSRSNAFRKSPYRHPHKFLERADFLPLGLDEMLLRAGFALGFGIGERAQAVLQLVVDVFRDERHFLNDLVFEAKFGEGVLQFLVGAFERPQRPLAFDLEMGVPPRGVVAIHVLIQFADARQHAMEHAEMRVAVVHLVIEHDAVKTFAGRIGQQFFRQRHMLLAGKTKGVNDFADLIFRGLDALGDFHLLFARQQRHLSHLLEIHPHRVVERIQPIRVFLLGIGSFDAIHLRLIHDFDFKRAQLGKYLVQNFRGRGIFRQHLVEVVVGQMPLFPREADEFLDFFRKRRVGTVLRNGVEWLGCRGFRTRLGMRLNAPSFLVSETNLFRVCEPAILTYNNITSGARPKRVGI